MTNQNDAQTPHYDPHSDQLATPEEVADFLRIPEPRLAQDRYYGVGPKFVKYGRRVRYRWSDVHAWVDANTVQRTDDRPVSA